MSPIARGQGGIARTSAGKVGKVAPGPQDCPGDEECAGCEASLELVVSGFTGAVCTDANGTYSLSRRDADDCYWSGTNPGGTDCWIECDGSREWTCYLDGIGLFCEAVRDNVDNCPPLGTWSFGPCAGTFCGGQTATGTLSVP